MQWGKTEALVQNITLSIAFQHYYSVLTTECNGFNGGREANALDRTLTGWRCTLSYGHEWSTGYWNPNTFWFTIGY